MNATPIPTQRAKLLDPEAVGHHRRLFCPEYDSCLDVAVAGGWTSWTCERCPLAARQVAPLASLLALLASAVTRCDAEHAVVAP